MSDIAVRVQGLRVVVENGPPIVEDVSLTLGQGEAIGVVGESGSGKTTTALALLGYSREKTVISEGSIEILGTQMGRGGRNVRRQRGRVIAYVPQDPGSSLNPSTRVGRQVENVIRLRAGGGKDARSTAVAALRAAQLPTSEAFYRRFPHELSGGQQQRITIALALASGARVVVLDEPTTGLDVVTQSALLEEITALRQRLGIALVYVSHDLAVVNQVVDRVAVMYSGRVVEEGDTEVVLTRPVHPYTRELVMSIPDHLRPRHLRGIGGIAPGLTDRPPGCAFAPRCNQRVATCEIAMPALVTVQPGHQARCIEWRRTPSTAAGLVHRDERDALNKATVLEVTHLTAEYGQRRDQRVTAAQDVAFTVMAGECVALVGESGSGKTTIARCIVGLHAPLHGTIVLQGEALAPRAKKRSREQRRRVQMIFQNPADSLNPRRLVKDEIARPARFLRGLSAIDADREVGELLEKVRLPRRVAMRLSRELSGGERQRVAIARALAADPEVIVCDEITSALDVSVQAAVLNLLETLQQELQVSLVFISHDLGVVASVADRIVVLEHGIIREQGITRQVLTDPQDEYTRRLIAAVPRADAGEEN